jgi:hypothetical protein
MARRPKIVSSYIYRYSAVILCLDRHPRGASCSVRYLLSVPEECITCRARPRFRQVRSKLPKLRFHELLFTSIRIAPDSSSQACLLLAAFTKGDFEGVYGFSVADAFDLAVELGGGIVWVTLVIVFGRFGLTLFESVNEIGLGDGLETEKRNAERGGGGVKAEVLFPAMLSVFIAHSLQQEHKSEEGKNGQESTDKEQVEVHWRPFCLVIDRRRGSARRLWLRRCF